MGQKSSQNCVASRAVNCCTTRGDDEARPLYRHRIEDEISNPLPNSPPGRATATSRRMCPEPQGLTACVKSRPAYGLTDCDFDGGTGGTGGPTSKPRHCECIAAGANSRFIDLGSIACIQERGTDTAAGRQALFSDKSLKPKLQRIKGIEEEAEALKEARRRIRDKLQTPEGKDSVVPDRLEEHVSETDAQPLSEWVRRLLLHEKCLVSVTARVVKEACVSVLGSSPSGALGANNRLVQLQDVKAKYQSILSAVDNLLQERISSLDVELQRLENEVGESEDLIALCFDKMDEEANGFITRECFIAFLCDEAAEDADGSNSVIVSPKDAGCLFDIMAQGATELTYERFKEEITHGCLQILRDHIEVRRNMSKRFRDYWF
mmetsp:Transcript_53986/g.94750  ORF Transcript_53986/g.94750 Transcript_53986/m.94750 type:complete len:378 (+) Transcript_53986:44-1177(+)